MLGLYAIMLISMLLNVKYLKGKTRIIIGIIIILCCIWITMIMNRVKTYREPVFAIKNGTIGSMDRYYGLGYKIGLEKVSKNNEIIYGELTIFNWNLVKTKSKIVNGEPTRIEIKENNLEESNSYEKYLKKDGIIIYKNLKLKEIYIIIETNKKTLKEYIENTNQTLDDTIKPITNLLEKQFILKDGGTTIYKSKNYNITIVKCNRIGGSKNIYIGNYQNNYKDGIMCDN